MNERTRPACRKCDTRWHLNVKWDSDLVVDGIAAGSSQSAVDWRHTSRFTQLNANLIFYAPAFWLTAVGGSGCCRGGQRAAGVQVVVCSRIRIRFSCNRRLPKPLMTYHFSDMPRTRIRSRVPRILLPGRVPHAQHYEQLWVLILGHKNYKLG